MPEPLLLRGLLAHPAHLAPLAQTNPRRPAGQVMRHHLDRQPGAVGGEARRRRRSSAHEMALFEAKLERALEPLIARREAAWWIDHRDLEPVSLLESVWDQWADA